MAQKRLLFLRCFPKQATSLDKVYAKEWNILSVANSSSFAPNLPHISVCLTLISRTNAHNIVTISAVFQPKRLLPGWKLRVSEFVTVQLPTNFFTTTKTENSWSSIHAHAHTTKHRHESQFKKRLKEEPCWQIFARTIGNRGWRIPLFQSWR